MHITHLTSLDDPRGPFGYQFSVTPEGESAQGIGTFYRSPGFEDDGRRLLYRAF